MHALYRHITLFLIVLTMAGCDRDATPTPQTPAPPQVEPEQEEITVVDPLDELRARRLASDNPNAWLWIMAFHPDSDESSIAEDRYLTYIKENSICTVWTQATQETYQTFLGHFSYLVPVLAAKFAGLPHPEGVAFFSSDNTTQLLGIMTELAAIEKKALPYLEGYRQKIHEHASLREEGGLRQDIEHDLDWLIEDIRGYIKIIKKDLILPSETPAKIRMNNHTLARNISTLDRYMSREEGKHLPLVKSARVNRAHGCLGFLANSRGEVVPYFEAILDRRLESMRNLGSPDMKEIPNASQKGVLSVLADICPEGTASQKGCSVCPDFLGAEHGAVEEGPLTLVSSMGAHLVENTVEDRLVTFTGCGRKHLSVVARHTGIGWRRVIHFDGVSSTSCSKKEIRQEGGLHRVTCRRRQHPRKVILEGKKHRGLYLTLDREEPRLIWRNSSMSQNQYDTTIKP